MHYIYLLNKYIKCNITGLRWGTTIIFGIRCQKFNISETLPKYGTFHLGHILCTISHTSLYLFLVSHSSLYIYHISHTPLYLSHLSNFTLYITFLSQIAVHNPPVRYRCIFTIFTHLLIILISLNHRWI